MLFDLCTRWQNYEDSRVLLAAAGQLGWDGVGFVTAIDDVGKLKAAEQVSKEQNVRIGSTLSHNSFGKPDGVINLKRLHVDIGGVKDLTPFHTYVKKFREDWDLISVKVSDDASWLKVITSPTFLIDIVQLDLYDSTLPFRPSRSQWALAATNGVSTNFMRNVAIICRHIPRDKILVTSGAISSLFLRSPRDILAIAATIFGAEAGRRIIYINPGEAIDRARTRRSIPICGEFRE